MLHVKREFVWQIKDLALANSQKRGNYSQKRGNYSQKRGNFFFCYLELFAVSPVSRE